VRPGTGLRSSRGPPPAIPWLFRVRACAVVSGLVLLLIVDVRGVALYLAWGLIGLALLSEAAATDSRGNYEDGFLR
jgi:hypothetical protein